MKCPNCNTLIDDNTVICPNCSYIFNNSSNSGVVLSSDVKFPDISNVNNIGSNVSNTHIERLEEENLNASNIKEDEIIPNPDFNAQVVIPELMGTNLKVEEDYNEPNDNQEKVEDKAETENFVENNIHEINLTDEEPQNNFAQSQIQPTNNVQSQVPQKTKNSFFLDFETILVIVLCFVGAYCLFKFLPMYINVTNYFDRLGSNMNLGYVFDLERPVLIKQAEDKYSYIKIGGGELFDQTFTYATDFYGDFALVSADSQNEDYDIYKYNIINRKGKVVLKIKKLDDVIHDRNNNVYLIENTLYNYKMQKISADNLNVSYLNDKYYKYEDKNTKKEGIISPSGTILYEFNDTVDSFKVLNGSNSKSDNYIEVVRYKNDVKSVEYISLMNKKSLFKIDDTFDYKYSFTDGLLEYYNVVNSDKKNYLYLYNGKVKYKLENVYNVTTVDNYDNFLRIEELEGTSYYYDVLKNKKYDTLPVEKEYDDTLYRYGYKVLMDENTKKYGLIDKNKKTVLEYEYDNILYLDLPLYLFVQNRTYSDIFILQNLDNSKVTIYDAKNKKEIISYENAKLTMDNNSTFVYFTIYGADYISEIVVFNLITYNKLSVSPTDRVTIYNNYITVEAIKFKKLYNSRLTNFHNIKTISS